MCKQLVFVGIELIGYKEKPLYLLLASTDKAQKLSCLSCAAMLLKSRANVPLRATAPGPINTAQPAYVCLLHLFTCAFCMQLRGR